MLIGPNNAGKSTIMDAVALVLEGPLAYNYEVREYDFHVSKDGPCGQFDITVYFSASKVEELPAVRGIERPLPVHGARVHGSRIKKTGLLEHSRNLIGADGKTISFSPRTPLPKDSKQAYDNHGIGYTKVSARWRDIDDCRPEVWLLRPDNLHVSLFVWRTGPLQKLASIMARRFFEEKWDFEYGKTKRPMPEGLRQAHAFFTSAVNEFPYWKGTLKPLFEETLKEYVGQQSQIALQPDVRAVEEWLKEQLIISFAAEVGSALVPIQHLGHGWQSVVRIAALDVLSKLPDQVRERIVLLFEEPETYLHPHLKRKVRDLLERLAEKGWYVIVSTHAPELIKFSAKQTIVRLNRRCRMVTSGMIRTEDLDPAIKFQERLDERGGHDMLFASRAILCEGQDDVFALRMYFKKVGIDLEARSVSVVRCGDVGQVPRYAAMANKLGIPWFSVIDEDLVGGKLNQTTDERRRKVEQIKGMDDRCAEWKGSLEACFKIIDGSKATPNWQARNVENKNLDEIKSYYPDYIYLGELAAAWLTKSPID